MNSNCILLVFLFLEINLIENLRLDSAVLIENLGYPKDSTLVALQLHDIESIDANTFNGFSRLETLYLHENKLNKLDPLLFKNLINLKVLWLESNKLVSFDKNLLNGLVNLELVCLFNNPISIIFPDSLKDVCNSSPKCVVKIAEACSSSNVIANFTCKTILNIYHYFYYSNSSSSY
jgi:hypothetical protein